MGGVVLVPTPGPKLATYRYNGSSSPEENPVGEGHEYVPDNGEGKARAKMEGEPPTPAGELPALLMTLFVGYHSLSQHLVSTDDNVRILLLLVVDSGCDDR